MLKQDISFCMKENKSLSWCSNKERRLIGMFDNFQAIFFLNLN